MNVCRRRTVGRRQVGVGEGVDGGEECERDAETSNGFD
jgi:hypothetical protein